jgi:hypothetical protein
MLTVSHRSKAMAKQDRTEEVRELRARRAAKRQGLELSKSRLKDPRAHGYGLWVIYDVKGRLVAGTPNTTKALTLDEVEDYLNRPLEEVR